MGKTTRVCWHVDELQVAPNPAQDYTVVTGLEEGELLRVFALDGTLRLEMRASTSGEQRRFDRWRLSSYPQNGQSKTYHLEVVHRSSGGSTITMPQLSSELGLFLVKKDV